MKTINKWLIGSIVALIGLAGVAKAQTAGEINGYVVDEIGESVPMANVILSNGVDVNKNCQTDLNGKFSFKFLSPGTYDLKILMTSYSTFIQNNIQVSAGKTTDMNVKLKVKSDTLQTVTFSTDVYKPVIDQTDRMQVIDFSKIETLPVPKGDIMGMILSFTTEVTQGRNGEMYFRGSRADASATFIDGQRVIGSSGIPGQSIANVNFYTGGIPAQYGDVTGGVIIVTTKDFMWGMRAKRMMYSRIAKNKNEEE